MKLTNGFGTVYKIQHLLFLRRCSLRPVALFFFLLLLFRLRLISDTLDVLTSAVASKRLSTTDTTFRNFEIVHSAFPFSIFKIVNARARC